MTMVEQTWSQKCGEDAMRQPLVKETAATSKTIVKTLTILQKVFVGDTEVRKNKECLKLLCGMCSVSFNQCSARQVCIHETKPPTNFFEPNTFWKPNQSV